MKEVYRVREYYSKIDWDVLGLIILNQVKNFFFVFRK